MLEINVFHVKTKLVRQRELSRHYHIQCKLMYPFEK